jgi:hypothetical protein
MINFSEKLWAVTFENCPKNGHLTVRLVVLVQEIIDERSGDFSRTSFLVTAFCITVISNSYRDHD